MTTARKSLICLQDTPYYHCIARCVRRAWLWGVDEYAGKDYSHRKAWVLDRLSQLAGVFAIDVCAYAIMSNHYHLVLHVDAPRARQWTQEEVMERWSVVFGRPVLVERLRAGQLSDAERAEAQRIIETWRGRLYDISWYMRCLNEHLARRANVEDDCKGRFWEGRYRSQALLDEAGLLTAMAYVDLNPIRAGMAQTPEASEFTSIRERIRRHRAIQENRAAQRTESAQTLELLNFNDTPCARRPMLPFGDRDYLELVDWTGRVIRPDKHSAIDERLPRVMQRLNIDAAVWQQTMRPAGNIFGRALGNLHHLRLHAKSLGQSWVRGLRQAERLYTR